MAINLSVLVAILLLVPLFYVLLAIPAFLLVRLDIPEVSYLFRAAFFGYFVILIAVGLVGTILLMADNRGLAAVFIGLLTVGDVLWRQWMMPEIDACLAQIASGSSTTAKRLRRLQLTGMAINACQLGLILAAIPYFVDAF